VEVEVSPTIVKRTMDMHVLSNFAFIAIVSTIFVFECHEVKFTQFILYKGFNKYNLIITFLNETLVLMHGVFGLFDVNK
jgi:hypothetical protein